MSAVLSWVGIRYVVILVQKFHRKLFQSKPKLQSCAYVRLFVSSFMLSSVVHLKIIYTVYFQVYEYVVFIFNYILSYYYRLQASFHHETFNRYAKSEL